VKDIYDIVVQARRREGQPLALATLVHAEGSSYRRPGARLLICPDGLTIGSLSGGCIEQEIAIKARPVLESGQSITLDFDTRRHFGCHGRIDIFIERVTPGFFDQLNTELEARRSCAIITTPNGSRITTEPIGAPSDVQKPHRFPGSPFVQVIQPRLRLLLLGQGSDTVAFERLCAVLGWHPVDVPDTNALPARLDDRTAAIVKSHNFGRDFVALAKLLPLNLRYVGLIGPKKRRDELLSQLLEIGVAMNAGFFAPAGLDLNAETPEEIALSIVSEIQRVFCDGSGQSLRDRKLPIHQERPVEESIPTTRWQTSEL
jgi:xanthine dehydrogenase accessory factor